MIKYKRIPLRDLITEHKKLVRVLEKGNKNQIKQEAKKQKRELHEYIMDSKRRI